MSVVTGLGVRSIATGLDAAQGDFSSIPIIDLAQEEAVCVEKLRDACTRVGFFYLTGHGIDPAIIRGGFQQAKRFFDLPLDDKLALGNGTVCLGVEHATVEISIS